MDVYRPNTLQDADEFRPFRGNVFVTQQRDSTTLIGGLGGDILTNFMLEFLINRTINVS